MSIGKIIRDKIKSIDNTKKITQAMEMVAASKMRKAQDRTRAARPYSHKIRNIVANLARAHTEYKHPFMLEHEDVKRVGFIIVTTDKGLCGSMNANVLRLVTYKMRELTAQGHAIEAVAIGSKGLAFLQRIRANIVSHSVHLGDTPHIEQLIAPVTVLLDAYKEGQLHAVYLAYTQFLNTMKQEPILEPLLPLSKLHMQSDEDIYAWDYIYEPNAQSLIDALLVRYVEALIYQAVVENNASEQSGRMVAMKAASDNAGHVIDELQLVYNKSRQAAITKELSEIVAGAGAV